MHFEPTQRTPADSHSLLPVLFLGDNAEQLGKGRGTGLSNRACLGRDFKTALESIFSSFLKVGSPPATAADDLVQTQISSFVGAFTLGTFGRPSGSARGPVQR